MKTVLICSPYAPLDYILEGLHLPDVSVVRLKKPARGLLPSLLRGLCRWTGLSARCHRLFFAAETNRQLAALSRSTGPMRAIIIDAKRPVWLSILSKVLPPQCECHLYFWTPVQAIYHRLSPRRLQHRLQSLSRLYRLSSFNPDDRRLCPALQFRTQFFRLLPPGPEASQPLAWFVGQDKGRSALLAHCRRLLESQGVACDFVVVRKGERGLSYRECMERAARSTLIVDITLGQNGLSLRPMEALYLGKKLLTNNADIRQCDFYHPDNIFILGVDSEVRLSSFLQSSMATTSAAIRQRYDINTWVEGFAHPAE
ncbi:MAG: hypothetical protein ACI353_05065 [Alloprevotella sp.]